MEEKKKKVTKEVAKVKATKTTKKATKPAEDTNAPYAFDSEELILSKFVNWQTDEYAQRTLMKMGYDLNNIKSVTAYIAEDSNGKRKVKLKVKLKPVAQSSSMTSGMLGQIKEKLENNESVKQLMDKVMKSDIITKIKGNPGKK